MKVETTLPLGKLDPGVRATAAPRDIRAVSDDARRAEALGYDGILTEETKDDPYIVMALAAQATSRVSLATAVAIAFPRSPTVTALSAWTLQQPVRRAVHAGARLAGQGPYRAALRHALVGAGAVAARIRAGAARDLGMLAERHASSISRASTTSST